jgi:hypothetical protein
MSETELEPESEPAENFWKEEKNKGASTKLKSKPKAPSKINFKGQNVRNALAQLVLTVVELLRELLEKQALRRIESDQLTDEQVENLGLTFMNLKQEVDKLKDYFSLDDDDLNIDLGPLMLRDTEDLPELQSGKVSAIALLDKLLSKGVVIKGDIVISVAEVDLIAANLGVVLASIEKARELYNSTSTEQLQAEVDKLRSENQRLKAKNQDQTAKHLK